MVCREGDLVKADDLDNLRKFLKELDYFRKSIMMNKAESTEQQK